MNSYRLEVNSDDLTIRCYCSECGYEMDHSVLYKNETLNIDIDHCAKCASKLEKEYDHNIESLEKDIAELKEEIAELHKEQEIYEDKLEKLDLIVGALSL